MTEYSRVLIAGAGGHGQVVADILLAGAVHDVGSKPLGFLDDDASLAGAIRLGLPIVATIACADDVPHDGIVVGIGDNEIRRALFCRLQSAGERFVTAIHPSAILSPHIETGAGTVICASVTVNPGAVIGENAILNTGCIVEHHCHIADHAHIAPGVSMGGEVAVGEATLIGVGSVLLPGVEIGKNCVIGAGSVVTADVPDNSVVVGSPAHVIRTGDAMTLAGKC
jgi:acetyltransferase EpsM